MSCSSSISDLRLTVLCHLVLLLVVYIRQHYYTVAYKLLCVWIWQNSWNADSSSSSTSLPTWYVKSAVDVGLEDASTLSLFPHMTVFCLLGWSSHFEDTSLILQMLSMRLSPYCYTVWAQTVTELWLMVGNTDERRAWILMIIAWNREQLRVCCDTLLPFICCVQIQ